MMITPDEAFKEETASQEEPCSSAMISRGNAVFRTLCTRDSALTVGVVVGIGIAA